MDAEPRFRIDAFVPAEMAARAEEVGRAKATMPPLVTMALAILAGAFIALGAVFATTATAGDVAVTFGIHRLIGGLAFSLGLILVVIAGAELFTGNNLVVMALAAKRITVWQLLRNWAVVYVGNFIGSVATAALVFVSGQYQMGGGAIGRNALDIALGKCRLDVVEAIALGILCNALVCLAIWLCFSARSVTDKVLAITFPITAFVAAGFEHSVANMFFVPIALFIKAGASPDYWQSIGRTPEFYGDLDWGHFLMNNLAPVTIGNIIGGSVLVGLVYWFIYGRNAKA